MSSDLKAEAQAAFAEYDSDNSGFIDKLELALVCGALGESLTGQELETAFKLLDTSGDGKISFDEFFAWWTDDSHTHTKATGVTLQGLRARALATKGAKYLKSFFATKLKDGAGDQKDNLELTVGEMKEGPKMGINLSLTSSDSIGLGKGKAIALDFTVASRDSLAIIQSLVDTVTHGLALPFLSALPVAGLLSQLEFKVDTTNYPTVRLVAALPSDLPGLSEALEQAQDIWPMVAGASASVHLGFNFKDIVDGWDTLTVQDFIALKAGVSLSKLPISDELLADTCQTIAGAPMALGLSDEIEGLTDLASGNRSAKLNPTALLKSALEFFKDKLPFPIDGAILPILMSLASVPPPEAVAASGVKLVKMILGRDLLSIDRFAFFDADNSIGAELSLVNVLNTEHIFDLIIKLLNVLSAGEQ